MTRFLVSGLSRKLFTNYLTGPSYAVWQMIGWNLFIDSVNDLVLYWADEMEQMEREIREASVMHFIVKLVIFPVVTRSLGSIPKWIFYFLMALI